MATKKERDNEKAEAMARLRKMLRPGQTIYFVVTHVSKSGMSRSIEFYIPAWETSSESAGPRTPCSHIDCPLRIDGSAAHFDGTCTKRRIVKRMAIDKITWLFARVLGYRIDQRNGGIVVGGCGMDMGFHCVYNVGRILWPKGTRKPHGRRNGEPDSDGGYALKSRQM